MSNSNESNIAASFFSIHNIITRGLKVSIDSIRGFLERGFQGEGNRQGFLNYIQALTSLLNSHHLTEDEVVFPYFQDMLPEAPFDRLMADHRKMEALLEEIKLAQEKCEKNEQLEANLGILENGISRLNDTWHPHIQTETDEFIAKADGLVPADEQLRLVTLFAEHSQKTSVPPYLTVPFVLYNLPEEERKAFSQGMPAEVLQNLVPVVWKEKWESMKPFLLD
jgi:hemerythrin-like domain-containing protein